MMKKTSLVLCYCLLSVLMLAQRPAPLRISKAEKIDQAIPEIMASADIPGLSIAIIQGDEIVYHRAFGYRSVDTREPVTDATIFSAASLSKALFAYGLMRWVEAGRFDLDKPLYEYFPYADLEHDARYKQLTARHVLGHTTGLPNWRQGEQLNFLRDPGQEFGYSGEGFVYLMKTVEHLSGKAIDDFMKEQVFEPLGMNRSSYVWQTAFDSDYAIPHNQFGRTQAVYKSDMGNAAYSLQTTALDYSRFIRAMFNQKGLQAASIDKMLTPQVNVEKADTDVQWGLGIGLQHNPEGKAFWHWGDNGSFKAFFIAFPEQQIGLVYFANSANALGVAHDLLSSCLGSTYPAVNWIDYEGPKAPARLLLKKILAPESTIADWPFMDKNGQHQDTLHISQASMNRLGYNLLNLNRVEAALRVFRMNSVAYPQSANMHDSYGEALLRNGQLEAAANAYARAAEIDTSNTTAQKIVYQIREGNRKGNTTFELKDYPYARSVQLAGDFNGWSRLTCPMTRENGRWLARIDLEPGNYEYKFVVDGVFIPDPANPQISQDEYHNSVLVKE